MFHRSRANLWSVVAFHVFLNAYAVSVPVIVTHSFGYAFYVAEFVSFIFMILFLKYLPLKNKTKFFVCGTPENLEKRKLILKN